MKVYYYQGPVYCCGLFLEGIIMNKKLLALLAVAAVGVSVAGATPQTQFNKGEFQVDLGAAHSLSLIHILVQLILKQKLNISMLMQNGTLMVV